MPPFVHRTTWPPQPQYETPNPDAVERQALHRAERERHLQSLQVAPINGPQHLEVVAVPFLLGVLPDDALLFL